MKEQIGNVVLNYEFYSGVDLYSEGQIEEELLEIVKNHQEIEFNKIIAQRNNWSVLYHLSHLRSNIIEWLPINKEETVLEIGSGCGAVTGTLSDKASEVTCIELSKKRSMINAYRNKHKDNIEIIVGNFQDIEKSIEKKYDYITLIGVFEYAASYIATEQPYMEFLNTIGKLLKDDGKIIIAIENKLGLKYWAGCKEDHIGKYYEGIEDYPNTQEVRTFSKRELEEMVRSTNLFQCAFYYPYPDYKLPTVIYSDYYLPKKGELTNNMRNYDDSRLVTFDESRVYDTIIKEELFPMYSNSYLVILEKREKV